MIRQTRLAPTLLFPRLTAATQIPCKLKHTHTIRGDKLHQQNHNGTESNLWNQCVNVLNHSHLVRRNDQRWVLKVELSIFMQKWKTGDIIFIITFHMRRGCVSIYIMIFAWKDSILKRIKFVEGKNSATKEKESEIGI